MWEVAFDPSMLANSDVIVNCPDAALAEELMTVLAQNGVKWCGEGETPSKYNSRWNIHKEKTCYWIESENMAYEDITYAEDHADDFPDHIRCTFWGIETLDFDTASKEEIRSILGV